MVYPEKVHILDDVALCHRHTGGGHGTGTEQGDNPHGALLDVWVYVSRHGTQRQQERKPRAADSLNTKCHVQHPYWQRQSKEEEAIQIFFIHLYARKRFSQVAQNYVVNKEIYILHNIE